MFVTKPSTNSYSVTGINSIVIIAELKSHHGGRKVKSGTLSEVFQPNLS